jgi:hypothetical protein
MRDTLSVCISSITISRRSERFGFGEDPNRIFEESWGNDTGSISRGYNLEVASEEKLNTSLHRSLHVNENIDEGVILVT